LGIKGYKIKPPTLEAMRAKIKVAVNLVSFVGDHSWPK
jgi:hypothetical protein